LFEAAGQPLTITLQDLASWLGQQTKHLNLNPTQLIKTLQQFEEEHHPVQLMMPTDYCN
jgi:hypothetical protein